MRIFGLCSDFLSSLMMVGSTGHPLSSIRRSSTSVHPQLRSLFQFQFFSSQWVKPKIQINYPSRLFGEDAFPFLLATPSSCQVKGFWGKLGAPFTDLELPCTSLLWLQHILLRARMTSKKWNTRKHTVCCLLFHAFLCGVVCFVLTVNLVNWVDAFS